MQNIHGDQLDQLKIHGHDKIVFAAAVAVAVVVVVAVDFAVKMMFLQAKKKTMV